MVWTQQDVRGYSLLKHLPLFSVTPHFYPVRLNTRATCNEKDSDAPDTEHPAWPADMWPKHLCPPFLTHWASSLHLCAGVSDSQQQRQLLYLFSPHQMFQFLWLLPSLLPISTEGPLSLFISGPLPHDNDKGCPYHLPNKPLISHLVTDKSPMAMSAGFKT